MLDWVPVYIFFSAISFRFLIFKNTLCVVLQVISSLQLGIAILLWFMFRFVRATDGKQFRPDIGKYSIHGAYGFELLI